MKGLRVKRVSRLTIYSCSILISSGHPSSGRKITFSLAQGPDRLNIHRDRQCTMMCELFSMTPQSFTFIPDQKAEYDCVHPSSHRVLLLCVTAIFEGRREHTPSLCSPCFDESLSVLLPPHYFISNIERTGIWYTSCVRDVIRFLSHSY